MRGLDVTAGYQVTWLLMFADYSRYNRSGRAAGVAVFLGLALTALWFMPHRASSRRALAGSDDPGAMIAALGVGWWGALLITLATLTTNFVNIYMSALALKSLRPKVGDQTSVWLIGGIGAALSLLSTVWITRFADFTIVLAGLLVPVGGILLAHNFVLRRAVRRRGALRSPGPIRAARRLVDRGARGVDRGRGHVLRVNGDWRRAAEPGGHDRRLRAPSTDIRPRIGSMSLRDTLTGAIVVAPMTKGSNLPYRRLCVELGARVLVSEMVVARRLKQRRRGEFALIRRAPAEPCFGVQLAGNRPDEMAWAAALVEARGADFVDLNLGCPIDHFTRKGLGAALARQPNRVRRIVEAMRAAVKVPVTVKIRLGWKADKRNYLDVARAAVDGGAEAITVHGRTREARYRYPADWDAIAEVAAAVPVPVVGNGDLLFRMRSRTGSPRPAARRVMIARGALIKPWIFTRSGPGLLGHHRRGAAGDLSPVRRARTRALVQSRER